MKILIALLLLFHTSSFCVAQQKSRTILFVGAHPDDETAISEVLHKYARLGNKVFVIIATDGKDGTRVTKIPAGDSLGMLRKSRVNLRLQDIGHRASDIPGYRKAGYKNRNGQIL